MCSTLARCVLDKSLVDLNHYLQSFTKHTFLLISLITLKLINNY